MQIKSIMHFRFGFFIFHTLCLLFLIFPQIVQIHGQEIEFIKAEDLVKKYYKNKKIPFSFENKSLPDWMLSNIKYQLGQFNPFSSNDLERYFNKSPDTLLHFRIRNGILYLRCNETNWLPPPTAEYTAVIYWILSQSGFGIDSGDFLLVLSDGVGKKKAQYPLLCFSKYHESNCVCIPDGFAIWDDRLEVLSQIDAAYQAFPWETKIEKAFWIGAANGANFENKDKWKLNNRSQLVLFSLSNPEFVWARFTHIKNEQHICSEMRELDYLLCSDRISPLDSCRYKYLIDVDGVSSAFHRCHWVLRSDCVSIKENSGNVQWYYPGIKPYVHYIPYNTDCSDLISVITWLRENDEKAKEIAMEGRRFAQKYLDTSITYLYLYHVLKEYNKLNYSSMEREFND